jgi:hypothetical protein
MLPITQKRRNLNISQTVAKSSVCAKASESEEMGQSSGWTVHRSDNARLSAALAVAAT